MTSQDGSKAQASAIWMGLGPLAGEWRVRLPKKQLAAAHFGGKILSEIKALVS
jgi:hypothetical protein